MPQSDALSAVTEAFFSDRGQYATSSHQKTPVWLSSSQCYHFEAERSTALLS